MRTPPSQVEMSLLNEFQKRQIAMKNKLFVIRDRVFNGEVRFDPFEWENTEFINCDFIGTLMFRGTLRNVRFENCVFFSTRFEDGIWENVSFLGCAGRGSFSATPCSGKATLFEDCEFIGSTRDEVGYGNKTDHYGTVGGGDGDVIYRKCDFRGMRIRGGSSLAVQNCNLTDVIGRAQEGAIVLLDNITGKGDIFFDGPSSIFSSLTVVNSTFEFISFMSATLGVALFENVRADLDLDNVKATSVVLRKLCFLNAKNPNLQYQYGLHGESAKIKSLMIEDCTFEGELASIHLSGVEDRAKVSVSTGKYPDGHVNLYSTDFETLSIRNTPISRGQFEYMRVGTFALERLKLRDANFSHSEFEKFVLREVSLSGKVEFVDTKIKERISERVTDTSTGTTPIISSS